MFGQRYPITRHGIQALCAGFGCTHSFRARPIRDDSQASFRNALLAKLPLTAGRPVSVGLDEANMSYLPINQILTTLDVSEVADTAVLNEISPDCASERRILQRLK